MAARDVVDDSGDYTIAGSLNEYTAQAKYDMNAKCCVNPVRSHLFQFNDVKIQKHIIHVEAAKLGGSQRDSFC